MSNHSESEHAAVASADATQLAAPFDTPSTCAKATFITGPYVAPEKRGPRIRRAKDTSKYRTLAVHADRNVQPEHEPWTHVHAANVRALGPRGAIVFGFVSQWSRANKKGEAQLKVRDCHGGYWLAASFARIEQQTGLCKHDAEAGIRACVDAGMIETATMEYAGERCLHFRIAPAEGMQIVPWPLIVGDVTGQPVDVLEAGVKPTETLKIGSQAAQVALLTELSQPADFPITTAILSTKTNDTTVLPAPETGTGEANKPGKSLTAPGKGKATSRPATWLPLADALVYLDLSSALPPHIDAWRKNHEAGLTKESLEESLSRLVWFESEMLTVLACLTRDDPPAQAVEQPLEPSVEPAEASTPADIPEPVGEAVVTFSHMPDPDEDRPLTEEEKLANLAKWLPNAITAARAADEAKAKWKAEHPVTAAVSMSSHYSGSKNAGKTSIGPASCSLQQNGKAPKTSHFAGKTSC